MSQNPPRTFSEDFRRFFLRGLVVLLPSVLTLWLVVKAYQFVDDAIAEPINRGVRVAMVQTAARWEPLQNAFNPGDDLIEARRLELVADGADVDLTAIESELRARNINNWWHDHWYMDLIGLLIAVIAVYVSGRLLGGFLGRGVYRRLERIITSVPIFKQVYPHVKQVVDFLFADEHPIKFNRVVLCEYPRLGIWSLGFMTGESMSTIRKSSGDAASVFIPSSPTPFTGYTLTIPLDQLIDLPITVEEAIRFSVSAGVLVPETQRVAALIDAATPSSGVFGVTPASPHHPHAPAPEAATAPSDADRDPEAESDNDTAA